jgi:signal transduction histidine kinase
MEQDSAETERGVEERTARLAQREAELTAANKELQYDITESKRTEEEISRRNRELSVLYSISRATSTSFNLEDRLSRALHATLEALDIEAGGIYLLEPDGETLTLHAKGGSTDEFMRGVQQLKMGEGVAGKAALEKKPVVLDIADYPTARLHSLVASQGFRTMASMPLLSGGQVVGTLNLATAKERAFPADEMQLLTAIGQQLGASVQNAQLYLAVQQELGERKKTEQAINELNQKLVHHAEDLAAANAELEAFSYSVSHDLRAPLRAIDGFSRILMEEHASELAPEARRYLGLVRDSTLQMGHLIDDLLAFSRLSRQPLHKIQVAPAGLVRQCLEELKEEIQDRSVEVIVDDLPDCHADPALLKQAWMNLLSNALKFSRKREHAMVHVGWTKQTRRLPNSKGGAKSDSSRDGVTYYVRDNGVGFDMKYSSKLFGVFQRLHRLEEYEGTGVGLAIVQRVIHRHGGRVWADAQPDQGATFYFTL